MSIKWTALTVGGEAGFSGSTPGDIGSNTTGLGFIPIPVYTA
jgi:hypothetical protein